MSGGVGLEIAAVDYNNIRNKVVSILGTGAATRGYGQSIVSTAVLTGDIITKGQWDALRYDISSIKLHQTGVMPSMTVVQTILPIGYSLGNANSSYDTIADQAILDKFNVATSQSVISAMASRTLSTVWHVQAQSTLTVTFSTANEARYFFNSGGKIRFTTSRSGGTSTSQNNAWTALLTAAGTILFGSDTPVLVNFYNLTNAYQTFYQRSSSASYILNYYSLEVMSNVANNVYGTATVLTFRITLHDPHAALGGSPTDYTDGNLLIAVEELKAVGNLVPTGTFSITSPIYSLSTITAS